MATIRHRVWDHGVLISDEPMQVPDPVPLVLSNQGARAYIASRLDADPSAGAAKLRKILEDCAVHSGTTDADYRIRDFKDWFLMGSQFTKGEMSARLDDLVGPIIQSKDSVINNWPMTV